MNMQEYYGVWPCANRERVDDANLWPRISIVTPNFNGSSTLETTILSVLCQDYPSLQYIVLDDGSTDGSFDIIKRHSDRLAYWDSHPNMGQYATINKGFTLAEGEIFAWLNSDDFYLPWTLRVVGEIFRSHPEIDWIMGQPSTTCRGAVYRVRPVRSCNRDLISWGLHSGRGLGVIQQESCFWRRSLWEKAGPLKEHLERAADFELWTRFAKHADLVATEALLGGFCRTGANRSIVHAKEYTEQVRHIQRDISSQLSSHEIIRRNWMATLVSLSERGGQLSRAIARGIWPKSLRGPILQVDFQTGSMRVSQRRVSLAA
jgi:glycosyltransferase involved in cell wall biosynthesis